MNKAWLILIFSEKKLRPTLLITVARAEMGKLKRITLFGAQVSVVSDSVQILDGQGGLSGTKRVCLRRENDYIVHLGVCPVGDSSVGGPGTGFHAPPPL